MKIVVRCVDCSGYGYTESKDMSSARTTDCYACDGTGEVTYTETYESFYEAEQDYINQDVIRIEDNKMKLFKIYQNINTGYDTFDSAVVVANSAKEAQKIHPCDASGDFNMYDNWAARPDLVQVLYLGEVVGEPDDDIYPGAIICASFNAG
jgi:hypothetical protein